MKTTVLVLLIAVVIALFSGLFFLFKDPSTRERALKSLIVRIGLAVLLMVLLVVSVQMGWIELHPLGR